jgi:hypothetical protein
MHNSRCSRMMNEGKNFASGTLDFRLKSDYLGATV